VLKNSHLKYTYNRFITPDRTVHYSSTARTIKEALLIHVAIPDSDDLHSAINKKLQKYTNLKEELTRIWQLNAVCTISLVLSTPVGYYYPTNKKLHNGFKLLDLRLRLYILMQKAAKLNARCIVKQFLAE